MVCFLLCGNGIYFHNKGVNLDEFKVGGDFKQKLIPKKLVKIPKNAENTFFFLF